MIKVGSFNIRYDNPEEDKKDAWSLRKSSVLKEVSQENFDICGLQEVLPHVLEEFKALKYFYLYGVCRDDGKTEGEMNPILINTKIFDILDEGTFWLSDTPSIPSRYETSACTRIASWVKLKHKESDKEFVFVNTHLDHESKLAREKQIEVIKSFLKEKSFILTGDFNTTKHEQVVKRLEELAIDVGKDQNKAVGTFNDFDLDLKIQDMERIDYIFISKEMSAKSYTTHTETKEDGRYLSDHFMISAEIVL